MTDQPPAELLEFARAYTCGHCPGDTVELAQDDNGLWHGHFQHAEGCPVKVGAVSSIPDAVRSLPPGSRWRRD